MRLTGFDAIEYAEKEGIALHKAPDSIDNGAEALTVAEAEDIADDDPELIWLDVPDDDYYGEPHNMQAATEPARQPRLAGQRPDELLPGQNSGVCPDVGAIGTPGGGLAAGGLGGTNAPDGAPDECLENAMAWGHEDHAGDEQQVNEPQAGRSGGAVGGTPAGKRASPK